MKKSRNRVIYLALLVTLLTACNRNTFNPIEEERAASTSEPRGSGVQDVTFAQVTDPHLFDAGRKRHGQAVYEEFLHNRAAMHWAILEINRIDAEVRRVDFVVFTGDWGLENVRLPDDPAQPQKCQCPLPTGADEGPVPDVPLETAVREVADELRALVVSNVFMVPGNSDICSNDPRDLHRYAEFVLQLKSQLPGRITDLTHSAEVLNSRHDPKLLGFLRLKGSAAISTPGVPPAAGSDQVQGFHLLGINSASFEERSKYSMVSADAPGNPGYELSRVKKALEKSGSYLIFTHIPDLKDPAPPQTSGSESPKREDAGMRPGWDLAPRDLKVWDDEIVGRTQVLGVFAGHLHELDRALYVSASEKHPLALRTSVAAKTWVAPPLAVKGQSAPPDGRTARGFLLATVTGAGAASVQPYWYVTLDQKSASEGDATLAEAGAEAREGNWEDATNKYAEAMKSPDSRVRATASLGYVEGRGVLRTAWWQFGRYLPPVRWAVIHPVRMIVAFLVVLFILIFFRVLRWIAGHLVTLLRFFLKPRFSGRALVITPRKLTETTNADLFASQLSHGGEEIDHLLAWWGLNVFAGPVPLLSLPSEVTQDIINKTPEIGGVNIGKVMEFLLALVRYFGWRVESQVGFCPYRPVAAGWDAGPAGQMRVFASLRWAWFVKARWGLEREARDEYDISRAAFGLAARIIGEAMVENPGPDNA